MEKIKLSSTTLKYIATGYFILIALLNLAETVWSSKEYIWRDVILLLIAALPLLINKRLFYFGYGLLLSIITLIILIAYIAMHDYTNSSTSLGYFLMGCLMHTLSFSCALAMVYIGTYSTEKNRFRIL